MRFLADENFPRAAVEALRKAGADVTWVTESAAGTADAKVLDWVARDGFILLTFDRDFGELARATRLPDICGIILFRMPMPRLGQRISDLASLVLTRTDWSGHFTVIEPGRVRMRKFNPRV